MERIMIKFTKKEVIFKHVNDGGTCLVYSDKNNKKLICDVCPFQKKHCTRDKLIELKKEFIKKYDNVQLWKKL